MRALAGQGAVILMISSDMEEILERERRVAVMHEGEITGMLERTDCTEENVMQLAVGRKIPARSRLCGMKKEIGIFVLLVVCAPSPGLKTAVFFAGKPGQHGQCHRVVRGL